MSLIDTWKGWVKFSNHLQAERYEEAAKMLVTGDRFDFPDLSAREADALNAFLMPERWLVDRGDDWVVEEVEFP